MSSKRKRWTAPPASSTKKGQRADEQPIPVTVLSGFLGAGKTTTLNKLLAQGAKKAHKYAVIVNDMSIVNIDAQFIKRTSEKIIELSNGCICCTLREDLVEQLLDIACSGVRYDAIIIESTGVGEPLHIAETFTHILDIADAYELEQQVNHGDHGTDVREEHDQKDTKRSRADHLHTHKAEDAHTHTHTHAHEHTHDHHPSHDNIHSDAAALSSASRTIDGARAVIFKQRVRLDCMVTVVDGSQVWTNFKSRTTNAQSCADTQTPVSVATAAPSSVDAAAESQQQEPTISDLLLDQVQFANIIIVNKVDLLADEDDEDSDDDDGNKNVSAASNKLPTLDEVMGLLQDLNPMATLIPSEYGDVKLSEIVNTKLFSFEEAEENRKWFESEWGESTPETDEYGVSSIVITSTRPFHPQRLQDLLLGHGDLRLVNTSCSQATSSSHSSTSVISQVIRAKGYIWMSSHPSHCIVLQIAGSNLSLLKGSPWWCTVPQSKWPSTHEFKTEIIDTMHKIWGDRRQRLVVIGVNMDKVAMRRAFDDCLLTDAEMTVYEQHGSDDASASDGSGVNLLLADPFGISMNADVHESNDRSSHGEL